MDQAVSASPAAMAVGPRMARRQRFRGDIEGMRAVAVLAVVGYHAGARWLPGGYVGVDLFFVVSGFLITGLLLDELRSTGTISFRRFYARRARRLLPLSAIVLVATVAIGRVVLAPLDYAGVAGDVRAAALFFANWHFAAGATDYMADTDKSPVLHFWSLSVEEQFYLLWPLLLLLLRGRGRPAQWRNVQRRVVLGLCALGVGSLIVSAMTSVSAGPVAYFGLHTRAWELCAGAALAVARPALARLPRLATGLSGWAGLGLVLAAAVVFDNDTVFPGTAAIVPVLGASLLLVAGATAARPAGVTLLLGLRPLTYVGRISYAWYLWHWPLLVYAAMRFGSVTSSPDGDAGAGAPHLSAGSAIVVVLVSFLLAAVSHRLVEAPVRRSAVLVRSSHRSLALGAALTGVGVLAAGIGFAAQPLHPTAAVAGIRVGPAAPTPSAAGPTAPALQMTPQAARLDRPRGTRPCYALPHKQTVAPADCRFGDPKGARTVVLLGDSQAEQWLPALDAYGKAHSWQVYLWAKSSCPFNDVPVWVSAFKSEFRQCDLWRGRVYRRLANLHRVDLVLMSRSRDYDQLVVRRDGSRTTAANVLPIWRAGAARTLQRLRSVTPKVVFLHATPVALVDVPACLSAHLSQYDACSFPRRDGTADMLLGAERQAAAGGRAAVVDLTSRICSADPCPVVSETGVIVYRDLHHLTATFARSMAADLGSTIETAATRR